MRSQWMLLLLAGSALPALFAQAEKGPAKQVNSAKQVNNTKQSAIKPIPAADWPLYSHDLACTRYSSLNQISAANVSQLALAWTYKPSAPPPCSAGTCLPLLDCERVYKRAPGTANLDKLNNNLSRGNSHGY